MFKNYIKVALRSLLKSRGTSVINIVGLSIGMACCIIIFLFVQNEMGYDKFHSKADSIFRVLTIDEALGVSSNLVGITLPALGEAMDNDFPEVVQRVRMIPQGRQLINYEQQGFYTEHFAYAEPTLFSMFDFKLVDGDTEKALTEPNTVVMSQAMAEKTFAGEPAIGKRIDIGNQSGLEVVGIMEDVPQNSHLNFDVVVSMQQSDTTSGFAQFLRSWQSISMVTYVELANPTSEDNVETKMEELIRANDVGENFKVTLQPLADVHLKSSGILFENYNLNKTDISYVYTLAAVGLFVILIASFNFMNLSTARSANRAQEVGVRKVFGAFRAQLINQFMIESVVLCVVSFLIALVLVSLTGGLVNLPIEQNLALYFLSNPQWLGGALLFVLLLGIFSGSYPALLLSSFNPIAILRGSFKTSSKGVVLRKSLVIFQFTISIIMIIGTAIVYDQLQHQRNIDKGFDPEQVVTLNVGHPSLQQSLPVLINKLEQSPDILSTARTGGMPGRTFGRRGMVPEGASQEDTWIVSVLNFDEKFMDLMDMEVVDGRGFNIDMQTDQQQAVLINEAMAKELTWDEPVGKKLTFGQQEQTVIGVVKDFHFANMRHKIEPLAMFFNPTGGGNLAVKFNASNTSETISFLQSSWDEVFPNSPLEYRFFNEEFGQQFASDERFGKLVFSFTWLAIFIACLGLFGLSAFTAEQKTKEIGVRKVLGASVGGIVLLLSKQFSQLIVVAIVLAIPVAYYLMSQWLSDYEYRVDINWTWFVISAIVALFIALSTVTYQSVRAASINPSKSLRYE
ncbi:cell division protein FtsX [Roseivirga spongicola]|uniref:Cell division protein FtsX n=1 Tax=Roseivirga spongicola TaxID=333140 RepID=A0A150XHW6_9BACT|nr:MULTISPECIES: ABC transporter permease [Roseivirga]KYG78294.1 cell division protein FtsX [Roseivirga spongicola]MBO6660878.1 ABC transporter permease [Roseivirga sp.]MBO6759474.1 ABC transporter permease [Roseivirga sp.]MBO6909138.1 ABC transporter permease [Roseivirga sp.]